MIEMDHKYLRVMMEAGYIYLGMQQFQNAYEVFEGLNVLRPESEIPLIALGSVEFCQGSFKKAIRLYRQALRIDPKSVFAKVYLGEALFFEGKKDEALDLLLEVKKSDPEGGAGGFAKALLDAIHNGFVPHMTKPPKESYEKRPKKSFDR